ncbi:MAG: AMP-binding protein [Rhodospirillales bacterium]|nr:AMP-binding protein [Rhodospirillales bacterium]
MNDVLAWHADTHPERPHIQFYADAGDGEVLTYGALRDGAARLAAGLRERDLRPGESVALMLPTGRDYFIAFCAVLLAGGVPLPLYPPGRPAQIEEHLRRHAAIVANGLARILVTTDEAKRFGNLLKTQASSLDHVVTAGELVAAAVPAHPVAATDVALLQYTSGSTGNPKGVVLTHANLLANIRAMGAALEVGPDDVFVSWLPLYHDMGLIGAWLGSLYFAIPLVVMSPLSFLARPRRWLAAIHRHRGTLSAAPNFAYELCLNRLEDADLEGLDLSCWRMAANGAEAVSPKTVERFCQRFAGVGFRRQAMMPMFGLAENSVGLAFSPLDRGPLIDRVERRTFLATGRAEPAGADDATALEFVACGRPLTGHQTRVVDPAGRELPERREGRLQFQGPSATSGYFRSAEATRRLFDGTWLETGDRAYITGGDVFITGRTKDVIIRAGRNIYPAELEEAVGAIEGIRQGNVAVFGSLDSESGTERLIVLAETRKRDTQERDRLRARVNAIAVDLIDMPPDEVVLTPPGTVAKTSSGKIRRAASRHVYEGGLIGRPRPALAWQAARLAATAAVPQLRRAGRAIAEGLFGVYGWFVFVALAILTWPLVAVLPRSAWRWRVTRGAARLLGRATATPIIVTGLENLPPPGRPCVFVANHASYLDGPVLVAALPGEYGFVAKAELEAQFVPRIFLRRIGAHFVERFDKETGAADARRVSEAARSGRSLMFFPEGTIFRMPGLMPFHMGAFLTAAEAGLPVVPVTIRGTRSILRDGSCFARPGTLAVTIGTPIEPAVPKAGGTDDAWARAIALRDASRVQILRHCGEPDLASEKMPM